MKEKELILLIGPAASGKGTLAEKLEKEGYEKITISNILRKYNVPIPKTGLVDDDTVINALEKALKDSSDKVVLDGFPRTPNQALKLVSSDIRINRALVLNVNLQTLIDRANDRVVCSKCGQSYTKIGNYKRPKVFGICDACKAPLYKRAEDNPIDVTKRYEEYRVNNKMILYILTKYNVKLIEVDASKEYSIKDMLD